MPPSLSHRRLAALGLAAACVAVAWHWAVSPSVAAPAAAMCGTERWPVKTLTDARASLVRFTPRRTSVHALRALTRPARLGARVRGVETSTYRVRVRLIFMKAEADSDIHLVVADPRNRRETMIVELPSPSCTAGAPAAARRRMRAARHALVAAEGQPSTSRLSSLAGTATISGVGFWDFKHGQRGVAPNAIELHPVVGFVPGR